ncbi:MAG: type II toxin-antitoxin system HipA family toxin [Sediminibacterium magnilacihabitans]|jgi:serine/threonine-protein kinase HipA|nr:type II toxin-antitoxin system HipA family toxin [Sediminibacterium magnilacihabitans]PQV60051.1 serine/threonine-protein kinase HipA [Sediminibacterium magnilacihabitans]
MALHTQKKIWVYAHWQELQQPFLMGMLSVTPAKGKESFSFEYTTEWLKSGFSQMIDPDLQLYPGAYYPRDDKPNFGIFLDSCPDRWGRVLMQRREAVLARVEQRAAKKLLESDFLLGVYDGHRMGALRFKSDEDGPFLNDNKEMASPPWTSLRELEQASLKFEEDHTNDPEYLKWLNMLIAPGSSLGGARPKASVMDAAHSLWIAKFPSKNDDKDVAAWEMVTNQLAKAAGINIAEGKLQQFNNKYHTYLTKRFDRTAKGERIHFASAMTLLGHIDGDDASGASYLELLEFISRYGADVEKDLEELWRRIVFSICVKNTDDHLRNHGFLLTHKGWVLSPAYDINPNEYGKGLSLNITETDNSLDLDLAVEVADYFRLSAAKVKDIILQVSNAVKGWKKLAEKEKISTAEQERMSVAFKLD